MSRNHLQKHIFSFEELQNIQYSREDGYSYKGELFEQILNIDDICLSVERSIQTNFGYIITWTLSSNWIIVPINSNNELELTKYQPLWSFLKIEHGQSNNEITLKEKFIAEYLSAIDSRINSIQSYLSDTSAVCIDEIMFIIKEHRSNNINSLSELLVLLENEKHWYINTLVSIKQDTDSSSTSLQS